jgi:hypothetical protein
MTEIDQEAVRKLLELELPPDNDAHAPTARAWLAELLKVAWQAKDDAFKRPFGFSGPWWDELYAAMVRAGLVEGGLDDDGDLDYVGADADALILAAIDAMRQPQAAQQQVDRRADWTIDPETGRTNASPVFRELAQAVNQLLRGGAGGTVLRESWTSGTAALIVAQLAHVHHLAPPPEPQAAPDTPGRPTTSLENAMLANIDGLNDLVRDMLQSLPDTADEQGWRDRAGTLSVCDPDGQPYRAYTEDDL